MWINLATRSFHSQTSTVVQINYAVLVHIENCIIAYDSHVWFCLYNTSGNNVYTRGNIAAACNSMMYNASKDMIKLVIL